MHFVTSRPAVPVFLLLLIGAAVALSSHFDWRALAVPPAADASKPAAPVADGVLRAGLESRQVFDGGDGIAHLGVLIRPPADAAAARTPVDLALVLDSSGSMSGLKIEHARHAARAIIEALGPDDRLTVIDYDSEARVLVPLSQMGSANRAAIVASIEQIDDSGGTALFAGVQSGIDALGPAKAGVERARRLILLSDGEANEGPSSPEAIRAALMFDQVTLSAIGLGASYDAAVMTTIADVGQGQLHHLTDPVQLAGILAAELESARKVVGRQAEIDLVMAPGVELLEVAGVTPTRIDARTWRVPVGELYDRETRTLSARIKVPVARLDDQAGLVERMVATGKVGTVHLRYRPLTGEPIARAVGVSYTLTRDQAEVTRGLQPDYMLTADRLRVSHVLLDAAKLLEEGDLLEAQALMRDERARLAQRRGRLDGQRQTEIDGLIALFRDPYVDARFEAAPTEATAPAVDFDGLVERVRVGQPIDDAALAGLTAERLRVLRNTAYARHGYRFRSADLQQFFGGLSWYRPDAGFEPGRLTADDRALVARVKQFEGGATMVAAARAKPTRAAVGPGFGPLLEQVRRGVALAADELNGLDLVALRRLRNAAYARHGYAFRSSDLRDYFGQTGWYRADTGFAPERLTAVDQQNVRFIRDRERHLVAGAGQEAVRDLTLRSRARARAVVR